MVRIFHRPHKYGAARKQNFRVRYRIREFVFRGFWGSLAAIPGKTSGRIPAGLSSGFLRGFFGNPSGTPEASPKPSRTLPEENRLRMRKYTGKGPETIFPPVKGGNGKEKNFRIRYRTLKSGPWLTIQPVASLFVNIC